MKRNVFAKHSKHLLSVNQGDILFDFEIVTFPVLQVNHTTHLTQYYLKSSQTNITEFSVKLYLIVSNTFPLSKKNYRKKFQ